MNTGEWIPIVLTVAGFVVMSVGVLAMTVIVSSFGLPVFVTGLILLISGAAWGALVYNWDISGPV